MNKEIIFIIEHPFWQRDYHRFGVEYLAGRGYPVQIWRIMRRNSISFNTQAGLYKGNGYYEYSFHDFKRKTKENRACIFIMQKPDDEYCLFLSRQGCRFIIISGLGGLNLPQDFLVSYKVRDRIKRVFDRGLKTSVQGYLRSKSGCWKRKRIIKQYKKAIKLNPPALIATSTRFTAKRTFLKEDLQGNVMYIHAGDYDRYIEVNRESGKETAKCIVYCDSGFADRDYDAVLSGNVYETARHKNEYFDQLEVLFQKMEDWYGIPVIVTGHPHTKYETGDFHGREIVFNQTCRLVKNAEVFIVNTSTAMNFAVLYDVPVLKIVNRYFKKIPYGGTNMYDFIKNEACNVFKCGFLDMDDAEKMGHPWDFVKLMGRKNRDAFLKKFVIDSQRTEKTVIEYVEEFIRKI